MQSAVQACMRRRQEGDGAEPCKVKSLSGRQRSHDHFRQGGSAEAPRGGKSRRQNRAAGRKDNDVSRRGRPNDLLKLRSAEGLTVGPDVEIASYHPEPRTGDAVRVVRQ